jgi:hypothetical protein
LPANKQTTITKKKKKALKNESGDDLLSIVRLKSQYNSKSHRSEDSP